MGETVTLDRYQRRLRTWYASFVIWKIFHYVFGITAIVCSVFVAALPDVQNSKTKVMLGIISAACTSLIIFLDPLGNSKAYIKAWRKLNEGIGAYQIAGASGALKTVEDAKNAGEEILKEVV